MSDDKLMHNNFDSIIIFQLVFDCNLFPCFSTNSSGFVVKLYDDFSFVISDKFVVKLYDVSADFRFVITGNGLSSGVQI